MALFDPPLYKPGNKKCPDCGHPQGWHGFWRGEREEWRCSNCQSVLIYDSRRRTLWWVLYFAIVMGFPVIPVMMDFMWQAIAVQAAAVAVIVLFAWWWLQSCRRRPEENLCQNCGSRLKPGFKTCRWCGADSK